MKWKGYPHNDNTWEPSDNLDCPELIRAYEENRQKEIKEKEKDKEKDGEEKKKPKDDVKEDVSICGGWCESVIDKDFCFFAEFICIPCLVHQKETGRTETQERRQ